MGEEYTVNVAPDIARRARSVASQTHRSPEQVLSEWLTYAPMESHAMALPQSEAVLLQIINAGLSELEWKRYHALVAKRRAEELTIVEQQELIGLSDLIEQANARRMASLIELAKLRNTSLERLMQDLGIRTPAYV